jgi:Ca2+-binding RTX toxin-like protein
VTGADTSLTWTGDFDEFSFATEAERGTFTFRGTDEGERLKVDAPAMFHRDVQLGGGDDTYRTNGLCGRSSLAKGNKGEDILMLDVPTRRLKADLDRRVDDKDSGAATRIRCFEGYGVSAKTATVRGTNRGDQMGLVACRVNVDGGPGKDVIKHSAGYGDGEDEDGNVGLAALGVYADVGTPKCGTYRAVIFGGRGRDTIVGGPGRARLIGGPGEDRVKGGPRRDVCQGERVRDCEKRT